MCGIVGYVGPRNPWTILLDGLERLEYRGYDSAGIAVCANGALEVVRCAGRLEGLRRRVGGRSVAGGGVGIGHTRWATHGAPTERNAHPHVAEGVAIVHNGIIENHAELAQELRERGCHFLSETDSEVLCHLFALALREGRTLVDAVQQGLARVRGSYAVAVMSLSFSNQLIVARQESPLVIGVGTGEMFVASDVPALLPHTRSVIYLKDGEVATLTNEGISLTTLSGRTVAPVVSEVAWTAALAERDGYAHFMLKEIHEQPRALRETVRGRSGGPAGLVDLGPAVNALDWSRIQRVVGVACGTSYYASLLGKLYFERLVGVPMEVELASEFRYRDPLLDPSTLVILVSQSGETADTLGALREAKKRRAPTLAICNVVESTLAREADSVLYTHAGPEIGVASTKAFTSQLAALALVSLAAGAQRGFRHGVEATELAEGLESLPEWVDRALALDEQIKHLAPRYAGATNFLYLGRGALYPIALEGALKLKEVSYIHAEGCSAGEIKHGPIALVDENMPVVILAQRDNVLEKVVSNVHEIHSRGGRILAVTDDTIESFGVPVEAHFRVPRLHPLLAPFVMVVPLQLFAYHVAAARGLDVDRPRNLAKSVTVE